MVKSRQSRRDQAETEEGRWPFGTAEVCQPSGYHHSEAAEGCCRGEVAEADGREGQPRRGVRLRRGKDDTIERIL